MEFDFFKLIQQGFYQDNGDPGVSEFYLPLCHQVGIRFQEFIAKFESEEFKDLVQEDFLQSHGFGITGFPSVLLKKEQELFPVTLGYSDFDKMLEKVDRILEPSSSEV